MKKTDILYIDTPYRPDFGSFAKTREIVEGRHKVYSWHKCRELFHGQLYNLPLFFFSHDCNKSGNIAVFMRKTEDILNVFPRSNFGPTQRKKIMWVRPSRWWTTPSMRRSLFTILLRAANQYSPSKDNFVDALFSDPYIVQTGYAVNRFFDGYTVYTGKKRGWLHQFGGQWTDNEVDLLLIKAQ